MWLKHCFPLCQVASYRERLHYVHLVILIKKHKKTYSTNGGRTLVSLRKNIEKNTRHCSTSNRIPQAVRLESKYQTFKYILSICLTVWQLAVQQKQTFSPWMPGMASRKLLKLSFMWSLLFRSNALWCALLSNCRWKIHVNTGIIFFLCMGNSLWCWQDIQSKYDWFFTQSTVLKDDRLILEINENRRQF